MCAAVCTASSDFNNFYSPFCSRSEDAAAQTDRLSGRRVYLQVIVFFGQWVALYMIWLHRQLMWWTYDYIFFHSSTLFYSLCMLYFLCFYIWIIVNVMCEVVTILNVWVSINYCERNNCNFWWLFFVIDRIFSQPSTFKTIQIKQAFSVN